YNNFFFYFDASYAEFQLWFPKYYLLLFGAVSLLKLLPVFAFLALMFWLINQRNVFFRWFAYNTSQGYLKFISAEGLLLLSVFVFYLLLYFLFRNIFSADFFQNFQTWLARGFLLHTGFQFASTYLGNRQRVNNYVKRFLFAPQLPHNIALLRILFFSYLIFVYYSRYIDKVHLVSLPEKTTLPFLSWLTEILPVNEPLYTFSFVAGIVCCLFIIIGFQTRLFLLLHAVIILYFIAAPNFFGKLWHEHIVIWISWF